MEITATEKKAAFAVVMAVAETIRTLGEVPSGHVYAAIMSKIDLRNFEAIVETLKKSGLVKESPSHLLTWVGPMKEVV